MIQYGKQSLGPEERQAILEVLNSDFLTTGPKVPIFEASLKTKNKNSWDLKWFPLSDQILRLSVFLNLSVFNNFIKHSYTNKES